MQCRAYFYPSVSLTALADCVAAARASFRAHQGGAVFGIRF